MRKKLNRIIAAAITLSVGPVPFLTQAANAEEGTATTGSASTTANVNGAAQGATQVLDFSNSAHIDVGHEIRNEGTWYIVSTNPQITNATLSALGFINTSGATITTVLPQGGLAGYANAISNLSLTLMAVNDIVNMGTISSAGNLSMAAGGSIINALPSGVNGALPVMQAVNNLNVLASSVTNAGTMAALTGNINIANPSLYTATLAQAVNANLSSVLGSVINVNNTGGVLQALNGTVAIGGSTLGSNSSLSVSGGDVLSQVLDLNGGAGSVTAYFDNITGTTNLTGGTAWLGSNSDTMILGNLKVDGDPTFFNNLGSIFLSGNISAAQKISIVSNQDIVGIGPLTITARDPGTGQGFDVNLIAGANITTFGSPTPSFLIPGARPAPWSNNHRIRWFPYRRLNIVSGNSD